MKNEMNSTLGVKKILFVVDCLYTSNNGTSISAQRYISELRKRGYEVRALCGDMPHNEEEVNITDGDFCTGIYHFPVFQPICEKQGFTYANADEAVIRQACDWADIVHTMYPFALSLKTIKYCNKTGKPVTAAFHVQPENITSSLCCGKVKWINDLIYSAFRRIIYSHVNHIHVPSVFVANMLRKHGYKARIHVISNGIHDDFIRAGETKLQQPKANSQQQTIKIMMVGRLSKEKRQDVIIKAMKYSKYADHIQLVFAGNGPEYKHYLKLCQELKLKNMPRFIHKQRPELIKELLTTDLYIHSSDMETEAISCIEAFATGLVPVIADSKKSATPQFALDERSLFKPGDPEDLARVIDYWLDRPDEKRFMESKYAELAHKYAITNSVKLFEQMLYNEMNNETLTPVTAHITILSSIKRQVIRFYKRIA